MIYFGNSGYLKVVVKKEVHKVPGHFHDKEQTGDYYWKTCVK